VGDKIIGEDGEIEEVTEYYDPHSMDAFWEQFKEMDNNREDDKYLRSKDWAERDWRKVKNKDGRSKRKVENPNYGKLIAYGLDPDMSEDDLYED
jgi:hypothetical protein